MNLFILLRMFAALNKLHRHDRWTRQQLEAYQQQQLAKLRVYAYQHSPFYQQFHKGLYDKPLEQLPVLTKNMMMANFDALVTDHAVHLEEARELLQKEPDRLYNGHYQVGCTSGTGGNPGIFLYDPQEWVMVMASFARGQALAGVPMSPLHSNRFAFILSPLEHHLEHRVGKTMRSPWANLLYLPATASLQSLVSQLNAWQPAILGVYATEARALAAEQSAGRLHIAPRWIFTSAELLTPELRHLIQQAWGVEPFDEYAATETAVIAAECQQHSGLHVYEDLLIIENVDEQNRPVAPGTSGAKLLVTVLYNRTQPLIRYEIGDHIMLTDEPCTCGRPFARFTCIQGRVEETLYLSSWDHKLVPVYPTVFEQVMDLAAVDAWQIIQRDDGLHVLIVVRDDMKTKANKLEKALRQVLEAEQVDVPLIHVEQAAAIPRAASGKQPLIKRETVAGQAAIPTEIR